MRYLKSEAPPDIVAGIKTIEVRADECFKPLKSLTLPKDLAIWSLLTGAIGKVEDEIAKRGDDTPSFTALLINLSQICTVAIGWVNKYGKASSTLRRSRRWNNRSGSAAEEAIAVAHNYCSFLSCFPMWHKNRYLGELLSSSLVRFTATGGIRERQISAYQKGFRPKEGSHKAILGKKVEQNKELQDMFSTVLDACRAKGPLQFQSPEPRELWLALLPEYRERLSAMFRRDDSITLGEYCLGDFKTVYAALLAICAAHEHLCFRWALLHRQFPVNSAVMVKNTYRWNQALSDVSGIPVEKCTSIVNDLTFGSTRTVDLHAHPFVPLDKTCQTLALAPQFPLHSRPDENVLRICSLLRPKVFDTTTVGKEPEMRSALQSLISPFRITGPATLPQPLPDVDLIVEDIVSRSAVIAEMKWMRKPNRPTERIERDAEVLKGVAQLKLIREFLLNNLEHLSVQRKLSHPLDWYGSVYYLLIARDHLVWVEPVDNIAILGFEVFSSMLGRVNNLSLGVAELLTYEWLPIEGRDFTVRYERAVANGAAIESEVFYAL